ncbi:putative wsc domain containing protein [Botrytis fragariae]|uniref:Putative wsc domain containing protein n=1 Tax=Botrytis fragariae TaxID=1964551 RepID=A0A8H6AW53_9HELO|nr:putative wsc domain containing protein [Botrytis fragariae]KAF5874707.1 putative wsc domain containing protein [Botrytis fragariae]
MVFSKLALVGTFAASATAYSATARTFAVNHFYGTGPLLTARVDPIVNPGTVGTHVHTIQGGSAFGMTMGDTTALDDSNCTSSLVKNDKSNYWTPSLYFVDPNDPTNITAVPMFYMNVYYFFEPTTDKITAFQPGHRMLVGNAALRTPPAGGGGSIVDYSLGTPQPIQVTCPRTNYDTPSYPADSDGLHGVGIQDPQNKGAGAGFPDQDCNGYASPMRLDAHFPSCYNPAAGLTDYKTNMDWPTKGNCPEGWIHTPHIFYEVYYNTPLFASQWTPGQGKQPFVLANGDPTGYGFHGDFISGWDVETLQQIIDNCDAGDSGMDKCPGLIGGLNDPTTSCTIASPIDEVVNGTMSVLPGGNSIGQWGSGVASVASSVVASATSGIASQASSVAVGSSSAVSSVAAGASSVAASVSNVASSVLGVATSAASISISSISLPVYQTPTPTSPSSQHSQTHTRSGASTKVAAASPVASEVVSSSVITSGGQVFTSIVTVHASTLIYQTVSVTAGQVLPTGSSVSSSTPAAISGYSYAGCYADQESSRALSGVTFADVGQGAVSNSACVAYCEEKGYSVAGTEYGGQCFCGQSLPSQTLDASECAMACEGDANETCGGSLALSVYSKSGASKRKSRHVHRHAQRN